MISYVEISEMLDQNIAKSLGFTDSQFSLLPFEYREALIKGCFEHYRKQCKSDEFQKKMALKQFNLEKGVKKKVLSIFKK